MKIVFFVPNFIGYIRIALAVTAFYYVRTNHIYSAVLYVISQALDIVDGAVARALDQCSNFGAILDLLTDVSCTTSFKLVLAQLYPQYTFWIILSLILNLTSLWLNVHTSMLVGGESFKKQSNPILKFYYTEPYFSVIIFVYEIFLIALYLHQFVEEEYVYAVNWVIYTSLPVFIFKTIVNASKDFCVWQKSIRF